MIRQGVAHGDAVLCSLCSSTLYVVVCKTLTWSVSQCQLCLVSVDSGWLVCMFPSCSSSVASSACGLKACRSVSCSSSCRRPIFWWSFVLTSTWYVSLVNYGWRRSCLLSCCSSIALQRRSSRLPNRRLTENLTVVDRSGLMCLQLLYIHKFLPGDGICSCKQPTVNSTVTSQYVHISAARKALCVCFAALLVQKLCQTYFWSNFVTLWPVLIVSHYVWKWLCTILLKHFLPHLNYVVTLPC